MTGGWLPWRCATLASMRRQGFDDVSIAAALQMPWQAVAARLAEIEDYEGAGRPAAAAGRPSTPRDPAAAAPPAAGVGAPGVGSAGQANHPTLRPAETSEDPGHETAKDPAPASEIPREGRSGKARKAPGTREGNGTTVGVQPAARDEKPAGVPAPPPAPVDRAAEDAKIAAFLAEKGATRCPPGAAAGLMAIEEQFHACPRPTTEAEQRQRRTSLQQARARRAARTRMMRPKARAS